MYRGTAMWRGSKRPASASARERPKKKAALSVL